MNKRDEKIANCDFDYWIIFIYICNNNNPQIALINRDNTWEPYQTDSPFTFDKLKRKIQNDLNITDKHCFKDRFVPFASDVNHKENTELNAWASFIRLKDKKYLRPQNKQFQNIRWFNKNEALNNCKDKVLKIAFNEVFTKDTFWECLNTEEYK